MLTHKLHCHRQDLLQLLVQHYTLGCEVTTQIIELRARIAQDKAELRANAVAVADHLIDEHDASRWAEMATHAARLKRPCSL
jgi:hypothetical protein